MHRNLRIKGVITLFAWMIIFMHGVIPHDHHAGSIHGRVSCCTHSHHDDDINGFVQVDNSINPESAESCHFNPDLLGGVDLDGWFIPAEQISNRIPHPQDSPVYLPVESRIPLIPVDDGAPGRAPPAC